MHEVRLHPSNLLLPAHSSPHCPHSTASSLSVPRFNSPFRAMSSRRGELGVLEWISCRSPPLPPCVSDVAPPVSSTIFSLASVEGPDVMGGLPPLPWYARSLRYAISHFPTSFPASSALLAEVGEQPYVELLQQLNAASAWSQQAIVMCGVLRWSALLVLPLFLVVIILYGVLTSLRDGTAPPAANVAFIVCFVALFTALAVTVRYHATAAKHRMAAVLVSFNCQQQHCTCQLQYCRVRGHASAHRLLLHFLHT